MVKCSRIHVYSSTNTTNLLREDSAEWLVSRGQLLALPIAHKRVCVGFRDGYVYLITSVGLSGLYQPSVRFVA